MSFCPFCGEMRKPVRSAPAAAATEFAAMILGGMGPYREPTTNGSKLFEGCYALYSGLLLVGVTKRVATLHW
jgi:hypothetical protein